MGRPRRQRTSGKSNPRTRSGAKRRSGGASGGVSVTEVSPVGDISGSRPTVRATVKDGRITLSKSDIYVYLDGEHVRDIQYRRTTGSLSFTPRKLSPGAHTVEILVDAEGTRNARKSWSFVVK